MVTADLALYTDMRVKHTAIASEYPPGCEQNNDQNPIFSTTERVQIDNRVTFR